MKRFFTFAAIVIASLFTTTTLAARELNEVPEPAYVDLQPEGDYQVTEKTRIIVVDEMWNPAERFAEDMMAHFGSERPMRLTKHETKASRCAQIAVSLLRATR